MTKIEILKNLPTPSDLRRYVQQLSDLLNQALERLDRTTAQVNSLQQLPDLVAEQVTQALTLLEPLLQMPAQVNKALLEFDKISATQRDTLEELAREMSNQAAKAMAEKIIVMDTVLVALSSQAKGLEANMKAMQSSTLKFQALPQELSETAKYSAQLMQHESKELLAAAQAVRPRFRTLLMQLTAAAFLGALLVGIGQAALSRLLPASGLQQQAAWASAVWAKATEEEKKLMNQIGSRPAR